MCRAVVCRTCGRPTWAGCGLHVEQVLAGVPHSERCAGHEADGSPVARGLRRFFGRG